MGRGTRLDSPAAAEKAMLARRGALPRGAFPFKLYAQRNADLVRYASEVAHATLLLVTSVDDPLLSSQRCGGWEGGAVRRADRCASSVSGVTSMPS